MERTSSIYLCWLLICKFAMTGTFTSRRLCQARRLVQRGDHVDRNEELTALGE